MFGIGAPEMMLLVILGVLLFGKRLPEVSRSIGKTIMEFKSSLRGVEDEMHGVVHRSDPPAPPVRAPQRIAPTAPKFQD